MKKLIDLQVLCIKGFILHVPEYQDIESPLQVKCIRSASIRKICLICRDHLARFSTERFKLVIGLHQENILIFCLDRYRSPSIG